MYRAISERKRVRETIKKYILALKILNIFTLLLYMNEKNKIFHFLLILTLFNNSLLFFLLIFISIFCDVSDRNKK